MYRIVAAAAAAGLMVCWTGGLPLLLLLLLEWSLAIGGEACESAGSRKKSGYPPNIDLFVNINLQGARMHFHEYPTAIF